MRADGVIVPVLVAEREIEVITPVDETVAGVEREIIVQLKAVVRAGIETKTHRTLSLIHI